MDGPALARFLGLGACSAMEVDIGTPLLYSGYECQEELVSYVSSTVHNEQTFANLLSYDDLMTSQSQNSTEDDLINSLKSVVTSSSTSGYGSEINDPSSNPLPVLDQKDLLLELDTYNKPQQQLSGFKRVHQMMASQKPYNNGLENSKNNTEMEQRYPLNSFSNDEPVVHFNSGVETIMGKYTCTDKTLSEINSNASVYGLEGTKLEELKTLLDSLSVQAQDSTVSGSSETYELPFGEEGMLPSSELNLMEMELSNTSCTIDAGCQPDFSQQRNVVNFMTEGPYHIPMEVDHISPNLVSSEKDNITVPLPIAPLVITVPQEQQKKKRGRPKKQREVPLVEQQNIGIQYSQFGQFGTEIPERSCKPNSLRKIRSLACEESESDQEDLLVEAKRSINRAKRAPRGLKPTKEFTRNSSPLSTTSSSDVCIEDDPQERRRRNNEASKRSREKRTKLNKMTKKECKALQQRNDILCSMVAELKRAKDIVTSVVISNAPQVNSIA